MSNLKPRFVALLGCLASLHACDYERVNVGRRSGTPNVDSGTSPTIETPVARPPVTPNMPLMPNTPPSGAGTSASSPRAEAGAGGSPRIEPAPMPVHIDHTGPNNPAKLSADEVKQLMAGGPLGDMKWLYPYDQTVFPRGMLAPLVMWNGDPAADALYLRIKSQLFEYKAVLEPTDAKELALANLYAPLWNALASMRGMQATGKQLLIPQDIWDLAAQKSLGSKDVVTLELSERANGRVRGTITSRIRFAQADFKGSIYYSACTSADPSASGVLGTLGGSAKVFRIPSGGTAELMLSTPGQPDRCQGCHSVSANGTRLLAQRSPSYDDRLQQTLSWGVGMSYQLRPDGVADPTGTMVGSNAAYAAPYPDGSKFLSAAIPPVIADTNHPDYALFYVGLSANWGGVGAKDTLTPATLYDASNGAVLVDTGIPPGAMMPAFSPDGTRLAFTDFDASGARGLAVMDYDTSTHKASGYKLVVKEDTSGNTRPGWPFFLPDNQAVIFVRTPSAAFTMYGSTVPANPDEQQGAPSDLYIVDIATGTVTPLAKAMGFDNPIDATSEKTYLPFQKLDLHRNYFPTVSQVAAGGYFWVFFDTWRHYGNLGVQRGLWGAAIDIRPDGYAIDPSHPPFYLPGQEFGGGNNHRAFVALDPCKSTGASCTSAVQCCEGTICAWADDATMQRGLRVGTCQPPPPPPADKPVCAQLDERCAQTSECCDSSHYCINGFCAQVELL